MAQKPVTAATVDVGGDGGWGGVGGQGGNAYPGREGAMGGQNGDSAMISVADSWLSDDPGSTSIVNNTLVGAVLRDRPQCRGTDEPRRGSRCGRRA